MTKETPVMIVIFVKTSMWSRFPGTVCCLNLFLHSNVMVAKLNVTITRNGITIVKNVYMPITICKSGLEVYLQDI